MSNKRPKRVTYVAWISIVFSLLSAIPKFTLAFDNEVYQQAKRLIERSSQNGLFHVPFEFQIVHALLGSVILIICSLFILRGKRWALYIYTLWIYSVVILTLIVTGPSVQFMSKTVIAVLMCSVLFSPKAMQFFRDNEEQD